jgi:C_GCAxxG_C_C family probable redox protein
MSRVNEAQSKMKAGFNCSQAILSTYASDLGLEPSLALKIASGFGGGMARMGETCGAVAAAIMVIGLKHGFTSGEDKAGKNAAYEIVREFAKRFEEKRGSIKCRELIECDISTPEGYQRARDQKLFETICVKIIEDAGEILEGILSR